MKKCTACLKMSETTHEHHVVPQALGGTGTTTLCGECHGKIHGLDFTEHALLTKAGIEKARARGVKLGRQKGSTGNYKNISDEARAKGAVVRKNKAIQRLELWIVELRLCVNSGMGYDSMLAYLKEQGMKGSRGGELQRSSLYNSIRLLKKEGLL